MGGARLRESRVHPLEVVENPGTQWRGSGESHLTQPYGQSIFCASPPYYPPLPSTSTTALAASDRLHGMRQTEA